MLYTLPNYDRWATSAPDEYDYPDRCEGTRAHKCGRFLAWRQSACERCQAELDADWREMIAQEADLEKHQREQAAIDLWYSDSYVDAMGEEAAAQSEYFEGYGDDLTF